jgi:sugar/nucleoside kinase (ribokinase family)
MKKYNIYGIGNALVDTEIELTDQDLTRMSVEKGLMTLVDEGRQHELSEHLNDHPVHNRASGGSACNTLTAASYFGAKAFYSCKVADDENGQFFLNDLKAAGTDCIDQNHNGQGITGKCLVLITPDAERSMNTYLGISESLSPEQVSSEAIAQSEYLYIEGYLVTSDTGRAAAIEVRKLAEKNNVKTAISLSDPGMVEFFKGGLQEMIGNRVNLLFCNETEAKGWADTDDVEQAIETLKSVADTFAVTLGAKGALVYDGEKIIDIAPHSVNAVDTNGAGDMFAGAFLYAITNGHSYEQAGKLASLASATVVSSFGPRLPALKHKELLTQI